jgi:hypothetical protein
MSPLKELELAAYLLHCERRLAEELDRCAAYLGLGLRRPLRDTVDSCLLEAHMAAVLEGGRALLAACAQEDLARLFGCVVRSVGVWVYAFCILFGGWAQWRVRHFVFPGIGQGGSPARLFGCTMSGGGDESVWIREVGCGCL